MNTRAMSRGSIFYLTEPGIGQGGDLPAQIRREGVELPQSEAVLAPSLPPRCATIMCRPSTTLPQGSRFRQMGRRSNGKKPQSLVCFL